MKLTFNAVSKDLLDTINQSPKKGTSSYDTVAEVTRTEGDIAWVHISGGVEETPVQKTIDCKAGDKVQIRVGGGSAWITGNTTSPPTDDTTANIAHAGAEKASEQAEEAKDIAIDAEQEAQRAKEQADIAEGQAERATTYANSALDQLGMVQDVIGVLTWATEHGSFVLTSDTEIDPTKVYFIYDAGTGDYTPMVNPVASELNTYYELTVDEAMQTYIMTHLAVTSRGLWVLPNGIGSGTTPATGESQTDSDARQGTGYKMLLSNDGVYLYDETGIVVSTFGVNISFNSNRPQYIGNDNTYIAFSPANGGTLTINGATINFASGELPDTIEALSDTLTDFKDKYEEFITIVPNPASITLGKSDGTTKVEITSTAVNFWSDGKVSAYASGQTFNAYEGKFETVMMQTMNGTGALRWVARSNGHLSLKKVN